MNTTHPDFLPQVIKNHGQHKNDFKLFNQSFFAGGESR
jgi:hypothetical protein